LDWYQVKLAVVEFTGLDMDALHVHAGVLGQIAAAIVLRRTLASPWPWLLVLLAALGNEWFDLAYETWPTRDEQYGESVTDLWNTMLLPTLLLVACRFLPGLFVKRAQPSRETRDEGASPS
jgi:CHASE2 domain-containing sensor protein